MELFIAYIDIDGLYLHIKLRLSRREEGGVDTTLGLRSRREA